MPDRDPPRSLSHGRYRIDGLLGAGGMARVYLGHDELLQVDRAIKLLAGDLALQHASRERFLAEARAMARLRHPHIVSVVDVGEDGGLPWMVMELVEGGTLSDHVEAHGVLGARRAAEIGIEVLAALGAAHSIGIVHRDVKPQNILVTGEGSTRLADFGIAHLEESLGGGKTRAGAAIGTLGYMAPEQRSDARTADNRADLYAVGTLIYALVGGNVGLDLYSAALDPSVLDPLPPALRPVIEKATRFKAADRYSTAAEMADALRATLDDLPKDPITIPLGALAARLSSRSFTPAPPGVMTMVPEIDDEPLRALADSGAGTTGSSATRAVVVDRAPEAADAAPPSPPGATGPPTPSAPQRGASARWIAGAVAFVGVVGLALVAAALDDRPGPQSADTTMAPVERPPATAAQPAAPTAPAVAAGAGEGTVPSAATDLAAPASAAPVLAAAGDGPARPSAAPRVGAPSTAAAGTPSAAAPGPAVPAVVATAAPGPAVAVVVAPAPPSALASAAAPTGAADPDTTARAVTVAPVEARAPAAASGPDLASLTGRWTGSALERPFTLDLVVGVDGRVGGRANTRLGAQSLSAAITGVVEAQPGGALRFVARETGGERAHSYEGTISTSGATGDVIVKGRAAGTFSVAR